MNLSTDMVFPLSLNALILITSSGRAEGHLSNDLGEFVSDRIFYTYQWVLH